MSIPFRHRHAGLTLIELMVALAIGSLLVLGLVQVFAASRAAYLTSEGMGRVQENARFALEYLQRDIRMAGHFGCVNDQAHWVRDQGDLVNHFGAALDANDPLNFNVSIYGYEAATTAPENVVTLGAAAAGWNQAPPTLVPAPVDGSDIIALRYFSPFGVPVTSLTPAGANTIVSFTDANPAVTLARRQDLTNEGDGSPVLFGVSDCSRADVFRSAGALGASEVTSSGAAFSNDYTAHASGLTRLYRANSVIYYVGLDTTEEREPALYRARFNGTSYVSEELVEGIESLQFLYGRDHTADIAQATPPSGTITEQDTANTLGDEPNEWLRVGLVQVGVLARSPNPAAAGAAVDNLRVLGTEFEPGVVADTRYRGSYESTIALRNRLFGN